MTGEPWPTMLERPWVQGIIAFLIYSTISVLYFGLPVFGDFRHSMIGTGPDPQQYAWFLAWWPYAIGRGLNPLVPRIIFYPTGVNLAWTTSCPALALLASPLTALAGPVVSLNVLSLLSPAAAAWSAYLLCRHVCKALLPSLAGGYLFGFSTYTLGQLGGHMSLAMVFVVPLAVYVVLLQLDGLITPKALITRLTALLILQYLISNEILAVGTLFGAIAMGVAMLVSPTPTRRRLWTAGLLIVCSYGAAVVVLSPYLYGSFAYGMPRGSIYLPELYSSDLGGFVVPTPTTLGGGGRLARELSARVATSPGDFGESTAYLGPFLMLVVAVFAISNWRTAISKLLTIMFLVVCIASLGPVLHINGVRHLAMPWAAMANVPLFDKALPGRFMMFAFLDAAVILTMFLARDSFRLARWALAGAALISLMPNLSFEWWQVRYEAPAFFSQGLYRKYLSKGEAILVLPDGDQSASMLWQAESGMYFRMAGGYAGRAPHDYLRWPIAPSLLAGEPGYDASMQLKAFLGAHDVRAVVLLTRVVQVWGPLLATLEVTPINVGDVLLYNVPSALLAAYRNADVHKTAGRWAMIAFSNMAAAAGNYFLKGLPLDRLTFREGQRLAIAGLPPPSIIPLAQLDDWHWQNLWFGSWNDSAIGIGIRGEYEDLEPLLEAYEEYASAVYFPYPYLLSGNSGSDGTGQLLMIFKRDALPAVAAKAAIITGRNGTVARKGGVAVGIPSLTSINGAGLAAKSTAPGLAVDSVETVAPQGSQAMLGGSDFDITNGVAIELLSACKGRKIPAIFLDPGSLGLTASKLTFTLPDAQTLPTGPASFRISNNGDNGLFALKSNAVWVPIGEPILISRVRQNGQTITVDGTGFSCVTVINLFNAQKSRVANLGGLSGGGAANIPLTIVNSHQFTFTRPTAAQAGSAFVQAINPPLVPPTSSSTGSAFTIQ